MAIFQRAEGLIDVYVALIGSPKASAQWWKVLGALATLHASDYRISIPERRSFKASPDDPYPYPLRMKIEWIDTHVHDDAIGPLVHRMNYTDALIVALDTVEDEVRLSALRYDQIQEIWPLLDPQGWVRPRVLLGLGDWREEPSAMWEHWKKDWLSKGIRALTDALHHRRIGEREASEILKILGDRVRKSFGIKPPLPFPLEPEEDLPPKWVPEAQRLSWEIRDPDPKVKTLAQIKLMGLYRKAGQHSAARVLTREIFKQPHARHVWGWRPQSTPPLVAFEPLRKWEFPHHKITGLILMPPKSQSVIFGLGLQIYRIWRGDPDFERLKTLEEQPLSIYPIDHTRILVHWPDRLGVLDFESAKLQVEASLPTAMLHWLEKLKHPEEIPHALLRRPSPWQEIRGMRIRVSAESQRVMIVNALGLWLLDLETLEESARLDRKDIVDAAFVPDSQCIWTVHRQGMVGLWRPGSNIVERVSNLKGKIGDASIAVKGRRIAYLEQKPRGAPMLRLSELESGRFLGEYPTVFAQTLKISDLGTHIFSLEREILRLYDVRKGTLSLHTPVRSMIAQPHWYGREVDPSEDCRYFAVLETQESEHSPVVLRYWG